MWGGGGKGNEPADEQGGGIRVERGSSATFRSKRGRRGAATAARWRGGVGESASLRELAYGTDGSEVGGRGVGDKCLQRVCILRHGGIGGGQSPSREGLHIQRSNRRHRIACAQTLHEGEVEGGSRHTSRHREASQSGGQLLRPKVIARAAGPASGGVGFICVWRGRVCVWLSWRWLRERESATDRDHLNMLFLYVCTKAWLPSQRRRPP